jgi:hypothetical protein
MPVNPDTLKLEPDLTGYTSLTDDQIRRLSIITPADIADAFRTFQRRSPEIFRLMVGEEQTGDDVVRV